MTSHSTPSKTPPAVRDLTKARILIVEDNYIIANDLRNIIRGLHYEVSGIAHSMSAALNALHQESADLVLIDIQLQEPHDGVDLAQEIRLRYKLPFIYITSYVDEATLHRAKRTQPYGYVVKPFTEADIKVALEVALYRHAYEQVSRREQERRLLLDLSMTLATVRDRAALLRQLFDQAQAAFGFHDMGLFVITADGQCLTDWTSLDVALSPSFGKEEFNKLACGEVECVGTGFEELVGRLVQAGGPLVVPYDEAYLRLVADASKREEARRVISAGGYQEFMGTLLRSGGEVLGYLCFNSLAKDYFQPVKFELFQGVADQVAVAVANILANEEITAREREKDQLLGVSTAVVTVRNRADLLGILDAPLKQLFGFAMAAVVTSVGPDYHQHLVVLPTAAVAGATTLPAPPEGLLANAGSPYDWMLRQPAARRILLTELLAVAPDYPGLREMQAADITESFGAVLRHGGRPIGFLWFHYHEAARPAERQLPLFQAVADQFSVALANILANEEILEREQEKTLQLAVTTALTNADEWAARFFTVAEEIGRVVPWDVCRFLFPRRAGLDLSWRRIGTGAVERLYPEVAARELGVGPLELRELVRETAPLYQKSALYGGKEMARLVRQYGLLRLMQEKWGVQSKLFLPVRQQGELVAVLILASRQSHYYQPTQLALVERLAPQLALGLENLFSFEKIEQQERELAQQLALNNALVTIKDSFSLYKTVAEELTPLVRLDSLSAWTFTADQLLHFTVLRRDESGAFADITNASRAAYPEMEALETESLLKRELRPAVYSGDTFAAMCEAHQVYRVRRDTFHVASTLELPLPVRNGLRAVLVFSSRAAFAFTDEDLRQVLPFAPQIALAVENLVAHEELNQLRKRAELEKVYLSEEIKTTHNFEEMVGVSPVLHEVFRQISQVAGTDATVLITGETGTGKELIARTLHAQSTRHARTLIKLNCAALPASLIESELFGHEKGAFTGAIDRRVGKFELAQGSTIFLDEIGELPLELQSKLLRVLQEREFERLGGNKVLRADVRVVAATNRNLAQEVAAGRFRADLYYRLSVFPIHMPALRERPEDIPLLAQHFARKFSRIMGKPYRGIKEAALEELMTYNWPGNIRELENLVEQAVIVCPGPLEWSRSLRPLAAMALLPDIVQAGERAASSSLKEEMDALERNRILTALNECKGRIRGKRGAALLLGLKPTTLESKMEKLGIRKEQLIVSR